MNPKSSGRKILWLALLLVAVGCILWELLPETRETSRLTQLPLKGFGFAGRDVPLTEAEATVFKRAAVLKRLYQVGGDRFVLLAVDSAGDRHAVHDPLYCFRGAGWSVASEVPVGLPGGESKLVRLVNGERSAEALYWMTDGEKRHASVLKAWWQATLRRLGLRPAAQATVLVLLQPLSGGDVHWAETLDRFPELLKL